MVNTTEKCTWKGRETGKEGGWRHTKVGEGERNSKKGRGDEETQKTKNRLQKHTKTKLHVYGTLQSKQS